MSRKLDPFLSVIGIGQDGMLSSNIDDDLYDVEESSEDSSVSVEKPKLNPDDRKRPKSVRS